MLAHTLAVESFARGFSGLRGQFSTALFALMAMVAVVLLMTCANIANLMLARAARRSRDVAIRISLGATTGRLIRQGLTESVMLASLGGAAGLLAGEWASGFLAHQVLGSSGRAPARVCARCARHWPSRPSSRSMTAILFGLAPALRATRAGRTTSAIGTTERHAVGQSTMKGMRPLVTAQLALSVVVVFAAVLLGRTLINFTRIDPGFERRSSGDRPVRCRLERLFTRRDAGARPAPGRGGEGAARCDLRRGLDVRAREQLFVHGRVSNRGRRQRPSSLQAELGGARVLRRRLAFPSSAAANSTTGIRHAARAWRSSPSRSRGGIFRDRTRSGDASATTRLDTEIVGVVRDARWGTLREPPASMVFFPIDQPPAFRAVSHQPGRARRRRRGPGRPRRPGGDASRRARADRRQRRHDVLAPGAARRAGTARRVPVVGLCGPGPAPGRGGPLRRCSPTPSRSARGKSGSAWRSARGGAKSPGS